MRSHDATPYDWVGAWSEKRAQLSPDAVGLVDATTGERYTYAELDRRANRTARLLRDHGVADGERVAVLSRNRPELVDLFFATGKTGGVLAPLSHRLAPAELVEMLDDVEPSLLVVEEPFADLARDVLDHENRSFDCSVLSLPAAAGAAAAAPAAAGSESTEQSNDRFSWSSTSRARSANGSSTTSRDGSTSSSISTNSAGASRWERGASTPPVFPVAKKRSTSSGRFRERTATRSPSATPWSRSRRAVRFARRSNSA